MQYPAVTMAIRLFAKRLEANAALAKKVKRLEGMLFVNNYGRMSPALTITFQVCNLPSHFKQQKWSHTDIHICSLIWERDALKALRFEPRELRWMHPAIKISELD
jgi:hypothetical protein